MEQAILILAALGLGYGQGVKRKRKKEGKEGGVMRHFKEKISRKWRIIREQDEEIWHLKEKVNELEKKSIKSDSEIVYTKGNLEDLQKELFSFMWHSSTRIDCGIGYLLYLDILNESMPEVKSEKYTEYVYKNTFEKLNDKIDLNYVKSKKIKDRFISLDFETIVISTNDFIENFNNYNFDVTFQEVEDGLKTIIEILA